jgi:hypothetical protein
MQDSEWNCHSRFILAPVFLKYVLPTAEQIYSENAIEGPHLCLTT